MAPRGMMHSSIEYARLYGQWIRLHRGSEDCTVGNHIQRSRTTMVYEIQGQYPREPGKESGWYKNRPYSIFFETQDRATVHSRTQGYQAGCWRIYLGLWPEVQGLTRRVDLHNTGHPTQRMVYCWIVAPHSHPSVTAKSFPPSLLSVRSNVWKKALLRPSLN